MHSKETIAKRRKQAQEQIDEMPVTKVIPPDPENLNADRSRWAEAAIIAFIEATGTDAETAIMDLTADLMHWCDRHGQDFDTEVECGRWHYTEETKKEETLPE